MESLLSPKGSTTTITTTSDTDDSILKSEEVVKKQELQSAEFGATLPKTDSSIQAYLFLVGAFAIEAILWGEYVYSLRRAWVTVHIFPDHRPSSL